MASDTAMMSEKEYSPMGGDRPIFLRLVDRIKTIIAERAAEHALMLMDDRSLADIGLSRGDVPRAVRGHHERLGFPALCSSCP